MAAIVPYTVYRVENPGASVNSSAVQIRLEMYSLRGAQNGASNADLESTNSKLSTENFMFSSLHLISGSCMKYG